MRTLLENLPSEIKKLDRWVVAGAKSKRPMCVFDDYPASTTNRSTWGSWDELMRHRDNDCYAGFVFSAEDDIIGIDFDHVVEDGEIREDVAEIVCSFDSYTEFSKSGDGLHILIKGDLPFEGKQNLKGVEIYNTARFFVLTGNLVSQELSTIKRNDEVLGRFLKTYFDDISGSDDGIGNRAKRQGGEFRGGDSLWKQSWCLNGKKLPTRPTLPPVAQGGRHMAILSIAGQWINADITGTPLLRKVEDINNRFCSPPLPHDEVVRILRSLLK